MNDIKLKLFIDKLLKQMPQTDSIQIVLGELIDYDENQIHQQWNELVENTPLEKMKLNIRIIQAQQQCMTCFLIYHPNQKEIACPRCGSFGAKIISGEEFYLESI